MADIDCDNCKNQYQHCNECIHADDDREDFYEPFSEEELKIMEQKEIEQITKDLIKEEIQIMQPDPVFMDMLEKAMMFRSDHHRPQFMRVVIKDGILVATDTYTLIEFTCATIPTVLINLPIIKFDRQDDGSVVFSIGHEMPFPDYQKVMHYKHRFEAPKLAPVEIGDDKEFQGIPLEAMLGDLYPFEITLGDINFILDKKYFNRIMTAIPVKEIGIMDTRHPVIFWGENAMALLLPIQRIEQ